MDAVTSRQAVSISGFGSFTRGYRGRGRTFLFALLLCVWGARPARTEPVVPGYQHLVLRGNVSLAETGQLLSDELGCPWCHRAGDAAQDDTFPNEAPILTGVGSRLRPGFIRRFLENPRRVKPGTTMPLQLRDLSAEDRNQAIDSLTHFLVSSTLDPSTTDASGPTPATGRAEHGAALYHRTGCVACHQPDASYRPASWDSAALPAAPRIASAPLGKLARKYKPGELAKFLLDPLRIRPSARMPRVPLSEQEAADLEAYLAAKKPPSSSPFRRDTFRLDLDKARGGRDLFAVAGCAACHEMTIQGVRLSPATAYKSRGQLGSGTRGCLADAPPPAAPDFGLSPQQRRTLRSALPRLTNPSSSAPARQAPSAGGEEQAASLRSGIRRRLAALGCLACHERDASTGPEPARAVYFEEAGHRDLGREGRFPPSLSGVGRKLTPKALRETIQGRSPLRPYLATRMPDYGPAQARAFATLFEQADLSAGNKPIERTGRNRYGRQLIGMKGLGCVACHDLAGHRSPGIGALDLAELPKRLRAGWFRDFLIDPPRFAPATRMPSYWPHGEAVNKKILGGNTARQIDSIWVYLMEIDQTRLPDGMEPKQAFELRPSGRPIVFRTFMTGVGMHAVAVGFPEGIHAAFDSRAIGWAQAWRGRFLDADSTWDDRFTPLTPALSDDLVSLPPGPPFAILEDAHSPWPAATGAPPAGYRFNGFRLDHNGVPTFLYTFGGVRIEDSITPLPGGRSLRRELRLTGSTQGLWFRAAAGNKIEKDGSSYRIDDRLNIRLEGRQPIAGKILIRETDRAPQAEELLLGVDLAAGKFVLVQEITW